MACAGRLGALTRSSRRSAAGCERELDVTIAGGQAVCVVVAAKKDHRTDLVRRSGHSDIEMAAVRNLVRRLHDRRPSRSTAAALEQIRRREHLSDGNALIHREPVC